MELADLRTPQVPESLQFGREVKALKMFDALTPQVPESRLSQWVVIVELAFSKNLLHEVGRRSTQHLSLEAAASPPSTRYLSHQV